jgi:hypothetical protein
MLATHEDGNGSGGQDVTANQSMGVNLTSAVKKDGVNIIQLQNVKAIGKITTHVIEALRKLDAIEVEAQEVEPLLIEHQPDYKPTVEEALTALSKLLLAAGLNIQEMCGVMRHGAATAALEAYANNADRAGTALDVKGSYVLALRRAPSELEMLTMGFKKSE